MFDISQGIALKGIFEFKTENHRGRGKDRQQKILFDDAPRPFHKQEHLLAKGKEVHDITALSFNN